MVPAMADPTPAGVLADPLAGAAADDADLRGCRIAIATFELVGLSVPGGIGTAYTALAHALAEAGAEVEVLFTGWLAGDPAAAIERYRAAGVAVAVLDEDAIERWAVADPHVQRAYAAHAWLAGRHEQQPYHVVHVPECAGHGGVLASAKRAGVSLHGATLVTGTHGSSRWVRELNGDPFFLPRQLAMEGLERRAVEEADVVLSPSSYLVDDMRSRGWRLPERTFVQQYVTPPMDVPQRSGAAPEAIDEVVFFGRLETRKGFVLFLDALDELSRRGGHDGLRVTLLGREDHVGGRPALELLEERRAAWPFAVQALSDLDQPAAVAYLQGEGRLAVVPSLADNLPLTVIEALSMRVPLIAAATGGIPEMIAADDVDRATIAPDPVALADAIERALREPPAAPRFAVTPAENRDATLRWHRALSDRPAPAPAPSDAAYDLHLAPGHTLDAGADEALVVAARAARADVLVFPLEREDGRIAAPLGGPAELAALAPVLSLGSALVRRGVLGDAVPDDPAAFDAALVAAALAGARVVLHPSPVGRARDVPSDRLLAWWPRADELERAARAGALAAGLPRELAELPQLAALTAAGLARAERERDVAARDRDAAGQRVHELDAALAEARDELGRLQAQLNRRDEELGALMEAVERERRALRAVVSRRPVRLALKLGQLRGRLPSR